MWTGSSKDNSFAKFSKPIAKCIHYPKSVTKSYIPVVNAPIKMDVPVGISHIANKSQPRMKRDRPVGSKEKNPRARKWAKRKDGPNEDIVSDIINISVLEETDQVPGIHENQEISINYTTRLLGLVYICYSISL